jgi:hypothetical protein
MGQRRRARPRRRNRRRSTGRALHPLETQAWLFRHRDSLLPKGGHYRRWRRSARRLPSILGDPLSPAEQRALNLKVKYRESFRPFVPSARRERVADWFEIDADSPYMLLVAKVKPERCRKMSVEELALFGIDKLNVARSDIPAVTNVDYSARVQTVHISRSETAFFTKTSRTPRSPAIIRTLSNQTDGFCASQCAPATRIPGM